MIAAGLLSVLLLFMNAFFVAMEFALVGARRTRLEPMADTGRRTARLALRQIGELNLQLAGAQLGITIASLLLGYVAEPLVVHLFESALGPLDIPGGLRHGIALGIGLSVVIFLHMVIGEMVPKNVAISAPEPTLLALAHPNRLYFLLFGPVVRSLNLLARMGLAILRVEPRESLAETHTPQELATMLSESHEEGEIEDFAHELLTGVLDFGERTARSVMVPVERIVSIDRSTSAAEAEARVIESGHSRLPVLDDETDEPLGFVHAKDLLALGAGAGHRPVPLRLIRRMPLVPPERSLSDLLRGMRRTGVHLALVTDRRGVTVGLVTLEDLLEELVGDIVDETDRDARDE